MSPTLRQMSHEPAQSIAEAPEVTPEALSQLQEAFHLFSEASNRFAEHYNSLEQRIAELNLELEVANEQLRRNLDEKQRVQNYLATLVESLPVGVIGIDENARLASCNRKALDLIDQPLADLAGRPIQQALGHLGRPLMDGDLWQLLRNGVQPGNDPTDPNDSVDLTFERHGDERSRIFRFRLVATHLKSPEQECANSSTRTWVLLVEDITEISRLEQQAARRNRLTAMGEIAMNVAHEIRNPLGSIELFASMLSRELSDEPEHASLAGHIVTGVRCADHIVANILQFAKPQRLSCSDFSLEDLIDESLLFAGYAACQKDIKVERDPEPAGPINMRADSELLKQVLLNLFLNAVQATPEGGRIGIRTRTVGKGNVEIQVWDTGCGFSRDVLGRIFDPFFSTRRKGTGLGLTIVHNIVSAHRGAIDADNRPEGGARFTIVLPRHMPSRLEGAEVRTALS